MVRFTVLSFVTIISAATFLCRDSVAQELTSSDSASIREVAVHAILDSLKISTTTNPIWVQSHRHENEKRVPVYIVSSEMAALRKLFPGIRFPSEGEVVFLCPEGAKVRMPGRGCPIKDGGIIVEIEPIDLAADSVSAEVYVIRSVGMHTWAEGMTFLFARTSGVWRIAGVVGRFIT